MADLQIADAADAAPLVGTEIFPLDDLGVDGRCTPWDLHEFIQDKGADVASAAVVTLGTGGVFHITGTTTITDIDFAHAFDGRTARLVFDGVLTLTNSVTLILPGGVDIKTAPGDTCTVIQESGDTVRISQYERAAQLQLSNPTNASIANQSLPASATTYVTDSKVNIPDSGVRQRTRFLWHLILSKTAAGTVAPIILVKIGTNGTTADATVQTFTFPSAGTAVADEVDIWIEVIVTANPTAATPTFGRLTMNRRLGTTATGWLNAAATMNRILGTVANFNGTVASLKAGLAVTLGASYVVTCELCTVETNNL